MYREIAAAAPGTGPALITAARHAVTVLTHMFSPMRMARRVTLLRGLTLESELRRVRVPTLVITGEPHLDRVVPVDATREYARMWPHAEQATLARTGHIGLVTRSDEFARIVAEFATRDRSRGLKPPRYDEYADTVRSAGGSAPATESRRRIV
jgi:pimeloyl-ACP methyl ester carboxylesterase